jgi:hypothetical protein
MSGLLRPVDALFALVLIAGLLSAGIGYLLLATPVAAGLAGRVALRRRARDAVHPAG